MDTPVNLLTSKPRYEILDGLRGVAALIVVAFHLFETYSRGPMYQILNHGYLAVDFFFVLSGFVIGYAYDDRWDKMSMWGFFKRRLIRLQPMVILGSIIGALVFYFGASQMFAQIIETPWWMVVISLVLACMMLPVPPGMDIRGWQEMNALNGASWSLTWEYLANILYATVIRRMSVPVLSVFVVISAYLTLDIVFNIDTFALLEGRSAEMHTLIGGWSLTPTQLYIGLSRLCFPFFCGLLMFRLGKRISLRGGFWWCSAIIVVILVIPCLGVPDSRWADGIYNAVAVIVLFPLLVITGAGSKMTDRKTIAACKWLGAISYPLYITHFPWVYMQMAWAEAHPDAPVGTHIFVAVSVLIIAISIAYASMKLYDEPIREWLKHRFLAEKR
ncbi:MAG: acyltransferase [Muribaculaceae bacterium]|nr:acyltransferase [Muribaculaceae bacterium]